MYCGGYLIEGMFAQPTSACLSVLAAGWAGVQGHQAACAAAQLAARIGPGSQASAACGHGADVSPQVRDKTYMQDVQALPLAMYSVPLAALPQLL
jgi:hypothetical protein